MPVYGEFPVVSDGEWQRLQPIWLKSVWPLLIEELEGAGVGGASSRIKSAKLTTSEDISERVPMVVPKLELLLLGLRMLLESSGVALKTQPAVVLRSFGKPSLVTPCSTL